jgi:ribosomal protein S12 methylthiotransferase
MKQNTPERPVRVGLISLGCAKNLVDAEIMLGTLLRDGVQVTNDAAAADVVIVNTCSFIDAAQEESVNTILQSAEVREAKNRGQALVVAGCLAQRYRQELPKLLPEVDAFMGIDQVGQVTQIVRAALSKRAGGNGSSGQAQTQAPFAEIHSRPTYIPDYATPRFRLTPNHFAYLKIAEGCNHPCSFCIIPRMRGSHRSRQQADVVAEAKALIAQGTKELNLISQDSTYYGLDLRPNPSRAAASPARFGAAIRLLPPDAATICSLLRELNALPGDFWIRLLYTHPAHWTGDLIETIAECPKVARYADIPLQHIHGNMLERMRRETSREYIVELLRRIRHGIPGIALRTTFIVGFPGETQECFQDLLDFIRETKFERLGVFTYSREEGTRAGQMAGQIPENVKRRRREMAMTTQHDIALTVAKSYVGRTLRVLVEREAAAEELKWAGVTSWEHDLLRGPSGRPRGLRPRLGNRRTSASFELSNLKSEIAASCPVSGGQRSKGRFLVARGEADAPDIDGRVYLRGDAPLGQFAQVRVVSHTEYDLIAETQTQ